MAIFGIQYFISGNKYKCQQKGCVYKIDGNVFIMK